MRLVMRPFRPENPGEYEDWIHGQVEGFTERPNRTPDKMMWGEADEAGRARCRELSYDGLFKDINVLQQVVVDMDAPGRPTGKIVAAVAISVFFKTSAATFQEHDFSGLVAHLKEQEDGQAKYESALWAVEAAFPYLTFTKRDWPDFKPQEYYMALADEKEKKRQAAAAAAGAAAPSKAAEGAAKAEAEEPAVDKTKVPARVGEPHVYIETLFTVPGYRGQGAAGRLLQWVGETADRLNLAGWAMASRMAEPQYVKAGFQRVAYTDIRRGQWHFDQAIMRRPKPFPDAHDEVALPARAPQTA